jgi:molecular chaperone Hsp33
MKSTLEAFRRKDRLIKGITTDGFFKITVVKTTEAVELARQYHGLSPLVTVLLGRSLSGTMLLAAELKGEERVRLDLEGNGPVAHLVVEANAIGEMRGFAAHPTAGLDPEKPFDLGSGLGLGVLRFSKSLYNEARPITGMVELVKGTISEDLAYYLLQSEQIPSAITVDVSLNDDGTVASAGGILIQALPGAPESAIDTLEANLKDLMPIAERFEHGETIDMVMGRVAGELGAKELARFPVHYFCRCTKDRFVSALSMLDVDELREMAGQDQELVCHYCNKRYAITGAEVEGILAGKKIQMN